MKKNQYIFFTSDGFTQDNNGNETEKCQILGWAKGESPEAAFKSLISENEWINKDSYENIMYQIVISEDLHAFQF